MAAEERAFYVNELKSEQCQCGWNKSPWRPFCFKCWRALSFELQQDIARSIERSQDGYYSIGTGYPEAYEAAVAFLEE